MTKYTFAPKDFKAFDVEGLENRMEALNEHVRPQLNQLGDYFADYFSSQTGEEFYPHVAKHARRSVNPPVDTWVAFAPNKRGYKMLPHFQIGLFRDQLFIMFGVMHEAKNKAEQMKIFKKHFDKIKALPNDYSLCLDHMKPEKTLIKEMSEDDLKKAIDRAINVKKGEFFVARAIEPSDKRLKSDKAFLQFVEETFDQFLKFYQ
ncbi:YktB family protein [Staphylococcus caprae]|uniref:YktB family protein n=1 Tax=Staphylococcus caprae TaxID=29380 RepID=UPI003B226F99